MWCLFVAIRCTSFKKCTSFFIFCEFVSMVILNVVHTGQFIGWEERLIWFWCILHAIKQYKNSIHTKYIHVLVRLSHCLSMWISFSILPPKISVLIKIYMLNELVLFTPWPWHFIMRLTNQMNFYELVDKPVDCLNVLLVFLFKFVGWKI